MGLEERKAAPMSRSGDVGEPIRILEGEEVGVKRIRPREGG